MASLNFQAIKERVTMEDCIQLLGLKTKQEGQQWRSSCPCGRGDDRALSINPEKRVFTCYGSRASGSVLDLIVHVYDCSLRDAGELLQKEFGEKKQSPTVPPAKQERRVAPHVGGECQELEHLVSNHPEVQALGLSADTAETLGIGFTTRGAMKGRVAVPVRLPDGKLVGYFGISKDGVTFHKSIENNVVYLRRA